MESRMYFLPMEWNMQIGPLITLIISGKMMYAIKPLQSEASPGEENGSIRRIISIFKRKIRNIHFQNLGFLI
jgi:hypothetical protein